MVNSKILKLFDLMVLRKIKNSFPDFSNELSDIKNYLFVPISQKKHEGRTKNIFKLYFKVQYRDIVLHNKGNNLNDEFYQVFFDDGKIVDTINDYFSVNGSIVLINDVPDLYFMDGDELTSDLMADIDNINKEINTVDLKTIDKHNSSILILKQYLNNNILEDDTILTLDLGVNIIETSMGDMDEDTFYELHEDEKDIYMDIVWDYFENKYDSYVCKIEISWV